VCFSTCGCINNKLRTYLLTYLNMHRGQLPPQHVAAYMHRHLTEIIFHTPQSCAHHLAIYSRHLANYMHRHPTDRICTDHSHVYIIWLFTCTDISEKESAQTTVMSTVFLNIPVYKFEEIFCTNTVMLTVFAHLLAVRFHSKNLAQTTVMSTTFGYLHA